MKIELLENAGIEYEKGLVRFNHNEALYQKFLVKFLNDTTFDKLAISIENKEYQEAVRYAHTLKGIAGNLSMKTLYEKCNSLVEALRDEQFEIVEVLFIQLSKIYEQIIESIKED